MGGLGSREERLAVSGQLTSAFRTFIAVLGEQIFHSGRKAEGLFVTINGRWTLQATDLPTTNSGRYGHSEESVFLLFLLFFSPSFLGACSSLLCLTSCALSDAALIALWCTLVHSAALCASSRVEEDGRISLYEMQEDGLELREDSWVGVPLAALIARITRIAARIARIAVGHTTCLRSWPSTQTCHWTREKAFVRSLSLGHFVCTLSQPQITAQAYPQS